MPLLKQCLACECVCVFVCFPPACDLPCGAPMSKLLGLAGRRLKRKIASRRTLLVWFYCPSLQHKCSVHEQTDSVPPEYVKTRGLLPLPFYSVPRFLRRTSSDLSNMPKNREFREVGGNSNFRCGLWQTWKRPSAADLRSRRRNAVLRFDIAPACVPIHVCHVFCSVNPVPCQMWGLEIARRS